MKWLVSIVSSLRMSDAMAAQSASGSLLAIHFFAETPAHTTSSNDRPSISPISRELNRAEKREGSSRLEPTNPVWPIKARRTDGSCVGVMSCLLACESGCSQPVFAMLVGDVQPCRTAAQRTADLAGHDMAPPGRQGRVDLQHILGEEPEHQRQQHRRKRILQRQRRPAGLDI